MRNVLSHNLSRVYASKSQNKNIKTMHFIAKHARDMSRCVTHVADLPSSISILSHVISEQHSPQSFPHLSPSKLSERRNRAQSDGALTDIVLSDRDVVTTRKARLEYRRAKSKKRQSNYFNKMLLSSQNIDSHVVMTLHV